MNAEPIFQFFHERVRQAPDFLPEGLVGHGHQLAEKEIAVAVNAALPLFAARSQNPGIFHKPSSSWDDNRGWVLRFIHEIRLEAPGPVGAYLALF